MQILFSHFFVIYMICQFFIPLQAADSYIQINNFNEKVLGQKATGCIMQHLLYPKEAKIDKIEGVTKIMVSLKNNQIYKLQIIQSSGYKILDTAALRAVEKSKICLQNVFDTYFNKIIFEYAFIMPIEFRFADSKKQDIEVQKINI